MCYELNQLLFTVWDIILQFKFKISLMGIKLNLHAFEKING